MTIEEFRQKTKATRAKHWEVAEAIGISPGTLSVWLRRELTGERLARVERAFEQLKGGVNNGLS